MIQKLYHDFLRSWSPNPGKYTIGCTIKGALSLTNFMERTINAYSIYVVLYNSSQNETC